MSAPTTPDTVPARAWLPTMLALAAIWGCSFLFISVGVRELPPLYLALGRVIAGSVVLLAILAAKREALPRDPRIWAHSFVAGAIGSAIPWTLFGYGEQRIPSLLAGIWNGITPLIVLPIAVLIFRTERFSLQRGLGLLIGFTGMLVVLGAWHVTGGADLLGQGFCMLAAMFYGLAIPYQKRFLAGTSLSGTALSATLLLSATVQLAVVAPLVTRQAPPLPWTLSIEVLLSVLALGALGSGLAFVLSMRNIRLIGASRSSMVTYLMPVFSILVGVIVLREHIAWYQPVGGLVVLFGVAVSQGVLNRSTGRVAVTEPSGDSAEPDPVVLAETPPVELSGSVPAQVGDRGDDHREEGEQGARDDRGGDRLVRDR